MSTEATPVQATPIEWPDCLDSALLKAQLEFPDIPKDKKNEFYNNQRYASLDSIVSTTRPALAKHGLVANHLIEDTTDGIRVTAVLKYLPTKEQIANSLSCVCDRGNPQKMGSANTYLRRYTLAPLLGVTPDEDDDGNQAIPERSTGPKKQSTAKPPAKSGGAPPADGRRQQRTPPVQATITAPKAWPDTDVTNLCNWLRKLPRTAPAFKVAWGMITKNGDLHASVDWFPVLREFASLLKINLYEKTFSKEDLGQQMIDEVAVEMQNANAEQAFNDEQQSQDEPPQDDTESQEGMESTDGEEAAQ